MSTDNSVEIKWKKLTLTGPNTPGGALLRRFWQPVALSKEFPAGSAPRHHRIMSEDLALFRDDQGRPGLLGLRCPHRNADLSYGRAEDGGLRCPYHGWLFDVTGKCLEQPNVPLEHRRSEQIRQKAYPCIERGGIVWTYMGPGEPPEFPAYPFIDAPEGHVFAMQWHSACNYLQGVEGNIDPSHTSFLHRVTQQNEATHATMTGFKADTAPRLSVVETSFGLRLLAERTIDERGTVMLRSSNYLLPNAASANGSEAALGLGGCSILWHVPIDDTSHFRFEVVYHAKKALPIDEYEAGYRAEIDETGMRRRTLANRFLQDREEMNGRTFAGVGFSFPIHDLFVTESMGGISDHRTEHLTASDVAIGRARRELLRAIEQLEVGDDTQPRNRSSSLDDFVTFTAVIDKGTDIRQFAADLAKRGIYQHGAASSGTKL